MNGKSANGTSKLHTLTHQLIVKPTFEMSMKKEKLNTGNSISTDSNKPAMSGTTQWCAVIRAYTDASYGGEMTQELVWSSRRHVVSAQPITEAEYTSCAKGAKDIRWLLQLLKEIIPLYQNPIVQLYTDKEAALKLTKTQKFHRRTRHIEHKYHYIRQLVGYGTLEVKGIAGKENPADILTKLLPMSVITEWKKTYMASGPQAD